MRHIAVSFFYLLFFVLPFTYLWAEELGVTRSRAIQTLQPVVEALLQEACGSECLGFKLEPKIRSSSSAKLESLGFRETVESRAEKDAELTSIGIQVLVSDSVSQSARETLKEMIRARVSHLMGIPIEIGFKEVRGFDPLKEKLLREKRDTEFKAAAPPSEARIEYFRLAIWPVTALILGVLALFAFSLYLRFLRGQKSRATDLMPSVSAGSSRAETDLKLVFDRNRFLKARALDLQWLIEEAGARANLEELSRLVSFFSAGEMTESLKLSCGALEKIAGIEFSAASRGAISQEDLAWLEAECDRAHWKRQEESRFPLKRLARLAPPELQRLFVQLPTLGEKAVLLAWVERRAWPTLLSKLEEGDRLSIAKRLYDYEQAEISDRRAMEAAVIQRMNELLQLESSSIDRGQLLRDFTALLSDEELKSLPKELAGPSNGSAVGQQILTSARERLMEIALGVDSSTLVILARMLNPPAKAHFLAALPKHLKENVILGLHSPPGAEVSDKSRKEAEFRARGKWLARVKELESRERGATI